MPFEITSVGIVYFIAAIMTAIAAPFAWRRRRRSRGALPLLMLLIAMFEWTFSDAMENSVIGLGAHLFWSQASYIGGTTVGVFLLLFALEYTGKGKWISRRPAMALFVLPAITVLAAFTNGRHNLIWTGIIASDEHFYIYEHGTLYWLITGYGFALVGAATVILLSFAVRNRRLFRKQALAITTAIIIPWVAVILYDFAPGIASGLEPSVTLSISGVIFTGTILRYRLLDLVPMARNYLVETMPDGLLVIDSAGRIVDCNPSAKRMFGLPEAGLIGRPVGEALEAWPVLVSRLCGYGGGREEEFCIEISGGQWISLLISSLFENGNHSGSMVIIRDVTRHRDLEQQLIQSQKMEGIGRLAGGVAHDLNNFLTAIIGYVELASRRLDPEDPVREELKGARKAGDNAADLTRQLLLFSRREVPEFKPVDVNLTVAGFSRMLGRVIGENYSIVQDLCSGRTAVIADSGHLEQVLMNLVVNARDSMQDGGIISIRTERKWLDRSRADREVASGEYCCLTVEDSGSGMDEPTKSHVFEPFFTTKGVGRGTGLGLSVVFGIVSQHGGWIDVDSQPGRGSRFTVCLPLIGSEPEAVRQEQLPLDELQGRGEKILLVEDDDLLRNLAERMLSENGYEVVSAMSAESAEALFDNDGHDIRIVFSDVVLPGDDGIRLIERLKVKRPDLRVLFSSGYSNEEQFHAIREAQYRFIPKPYVLPQLLKTLREIA